MSVFQFQALTIEGQELSLSHFEGKVMLIVNTASKCGFTPQYKELQALYEKYKDRGFIVLGFPCNQFLNQEPGSEQEIKSFCESTYRVTFPMFAKIDVKGANAHPLFRYLTKKVPGLLGSSIKWNFTKFLIDANGNVVKRYPPTTKPNEIINEIERLL